jgi:hypothetical protein
VLARVDVRRRMHGLDGEKVFEHRVPLSNKAPSRSVPDVSDVPGQARPPDFHWERSIRSVHGPSAGRGLPDPVEEARLPVAAIAMREAGRT